MDPRIEEIASTKLGKPAGEQPATAEEAVMTEAAPAPEGDNPAPETPAEEALPELYKIKFGEEERELSPTQIASTFERYAALNSKHAKMAPAVQFIEQLMENSGLEADQLTEALRERLLNASNSPATSKSDETKPSDKADDGDDLAKWEQENALTLPPGYRDASAKMNKIEQSIGQLTQMMQTILQQQKGVADAAAQATTNAHSTQVSAVKQQIANNLNQAQSKLGLPDDAVQDFMMFAGERGYTMEDFADPQLTMRIAQDFNNNRNSPEMERLRQIQKRRQAMTGGVGSTPAAPNAGGAAEPAPQGHLQQLTQHIMAKRA